MFSTWYKFRVLQQDGKLKIIDFGAMRCYDPKKNYDTTCLGTRGYAAPEQFGGLGQTDSRADIYALGALMHYMLTGLNPQQPPYASQPIRAINPKLPANLEAIIIKCMQPARENRYQTVESLLKALNGEPEKKGLFARLLGKR